MNEKRWSGRLWLTIITGFVFAYATYKGMLKGETISAIIAMVFISYFQRNDRNGGTNGKDLGSH